MAIVSVRRWSRKLLSKATLSEPIPQDGAREVYTPLFPIVEPTSPAIEAEPPAATGITPIITVRPTGQLANRMIQHMTAMSLAAKVPGSKISRIHLPEWGVDEQEIKGASPPQLDIGGMYADVDRVASEMRDGKLASVTISGYVQNVTNFLDKNAYCQVFAPKLDVAGYGDDVLLVNVRMAEILTANFPPYVLIPVSFYKEMVRLTGLRPVFFGQLTPSPYLDDLRAAFPEAEFVPGSGAIHDFEVLRRSKNIVMSVSTFSWLACWLSDADRIIMPLTGLFNPVYGQHYAGGLDLIPKSDPRYVFFLFPLNDAVTQDKFRAVHRVLDGRWRVTTSAWLAELPKRRLQLTRSLAAHVEIFDEDYYLSYYSGLADAKRQGFIKSGLEHYINHGFNERRSPCHIGMDYAIRYPDASIAIAEGRFFDLIHFHAERGRLLGYAIRPSAMPESQIESGSDPDLAQG